MTEPASLSVVVGWAGPPAALAPCLEALEPQRDGVEVLVCEAQASPAELRARFGWARFVVEPGATVPVLWREGIDRSGGDVVALTIGCMRPAEDWVATIRERLGARGGHDVLAGAIDPDGGLRLSDWGEFFCRYAPDMLPFAAHECRDLPGDNSAYKRELLARTRERYRDGFWEPVVNRALADDGVVLWHDPALVVRQGRSAGSRAFARQRLVHGRAHGRQRGARFSRARNLAGVLGAPLVPVLLTLRILRQVGARGRLRARAVAALPAIALFNVAWAAGEARGHLDALHGR